METHSLATGKPYHAAADKLEALTQALQSEETRQFNHSELEMFIDQKQREVSRLLYEESIQRQGVGDVGAVVQGLDGVDRTHKRVRVRHLKSIFGEISIARTGYSQPESDSVFPLDGQLNLPEDAYSHTLRRLLGGEVAKNSFDEAIDSVQSRTGVVIPKRQAEELSQKAAADFDLFYEHRRGEGPAPSGMDPPPILVLTTDGKGIAMRPEDLREATRKRAAASTPKLKKRVSPGEKRQAKRMAQVASVYSIDRHVRTPEQVAGTASRPDESPPRPVDKRVWASVEKDQDVVIAGMFHEAKARDPDYEKEWVVLVDGQCSQRDRIKAQAKKDGVLITMIIDIIHVIEYLWKAARCFFEENSRAAEAWVTDRLLLILRGKAKTVAAGIRRSATFRGLGAVARKPVDTCAQYLHNNAAYLAYDEYLKKGYPIATGVIEGACRHLVKDRMDITGARWSLVGAEAILKLRSLHVSGDLNDYWNFHQAQERLRNHVRRYAKPEILQTRELRWVT